MSKNLILIIRINKKKEIMKTKYMLLIYTIYFILYIQQPLTICRHDWYEKLTQS